MTAVDALRPINVEIITLLIDLGADVNYTGFRDLLYPIGGTPLHLIAAYDGLSCQGAGCSEQARSLMIPNKIDMINILVKRGADLRSINQVGQMPFELARHPQIVQALKPSLN